MGEEVLLLVKLKTVGIVLVSAAIGAVLSLVITLNVVDKKFEELEVVVDNSLLMAAGNGIVKEYLLGEVSQEYSYTNLKKLSEMLSGDKKASSVSVGMDKLSQLIEIEDNESVERYWSEIFIPDIHTYLINAQKEFK